MSSGNGSAASEDDKKSRGNILFNVTEHLRPGLMLQEGDDAQEHTLKLLLKSRNIMDKHIHDRLHETYDGLKDRRHVIKRGYIARLKQWRKIGEFRNGSLDLKEFTVISSQDAHSKWLWMNKSQVSSITTASSESTISGPSSHHAVGDEAESASPAMESDASEDGPAAADPGFPGGPTDDSGNNADRRPEYGIFTMDSDGCTSQNPAAVISAYEMRRLDAGEEIEVAGNPFADSYDADAEEQTDAS